MIFGAGSFAECVRFYLEQDGEYEVVGFTIDEVAADAGQLGGLPIVPWDEVVRAFPPGELEMYVAIGYRRVNCLRAEVYARAKSAGYRLLSYVSSRATTWPGLELGDNCFVFEDNTIQPFVRIGNDVVLWSGNHIGHHATIGDHCFISSHVVVSGHVSVGAYTFMGVNATTRDGISIGERCVIGAGALLLEDAADGQVYPAQRTRAGERQSDEIDF